MAKKRINKAFYKGVDPSEGYPSNATDALGKGIAVGVSALGIDLKKKSKDPVADAAWAKRLKQKYKEEFLPSNEDGSVRMPENVENQMETDTIAVKERIKDLEKLPKDMNTDYSIDLSKKYLNKLRDVYKGKPTTVNEFEVRKNPTSGGLYNFEKTPFNAMGNFTMRYNKEKDVVEYNDTYDFNQYEKVVPGEPFEIKGEIRQHQSGGSFTRKIPTMGRKQSIREREWLNNWFDSRQEVLEQNISNSSKQEESSSVTDLIKERINKVPEYFVEEFSNKNTMGKYIKTANGNPLIQYKGTVPSSSTRVHELNHAGDSGVYIENSVNNITKGKLKKGASKHVKENSEYYQDPEEVHSRLMELRMGNDLDPKKEYSPSDVKKLRKKGQWNTLYNTYDDKTISELLNGIASTSQKTNTKFSKKGGNMETKNRIQKKQLGGKVYGNQYTGLSTKEAKELHQLQTLDLLKAKRKEQAQKGAKAATDTMGEFGEDYVYPAMKLASAFTPVGTVVAGMDAREKFNEGDTTGAIVTAGLEALPYGLGKVSKGARIFNKLGGKKAAKFIASRSTKVAADAVNKVVNSPIPPQQFFVQSQQGGGNVSKTYPSNFPNIQKIADPNSKFMTQQFSKADSTSLSPIISKLDRYVGKKGGYNRLNPMEQKNLSGLSKKLLNPEIPEEAAQDEVLTKLNADISAADNQDVGKLLNTDFKGFRDKPIGEKVKFALKNKPSSMSWKNTAKYTNYMLKGPLASVFQQGGSIQNPFLSTSFVQDKPLDSSGYEEKTNEFFPSFNQSVLQASAHDFIPDETTPNYSPAGKISGKKAEIAPAATKAKVELKPMEKKIVPEEVTMNKSNYNSNYEKEGHLGICEQGAGMCSAFAQRELAHNTGLPLKTVRNTLGVSGDAWKVVNNAIKKGASYKYKSYDKNFKNEAGNIARGDVITMNTGGGSKYQSAADVTGRGATHIGVIDSDVQKDGAGNYVFVVHNVLGQKYRQRMYLDGDKKMKVQGWRNIAGVEIISPNYSLLDKS